MQRHFVGITLYIDPELLQDVNDNIQGKTQTEKLRLCVQEGYERLTVKE
jgi:hypothetical protein